MVLEQLHIPGLKKREKHFNQNLMQYTKIISKQTRDLNIKYKSVQFLEKSIEDLRFGEEFLLMAPKVFSLKKNNKINKLSFVTIKKKPFCSAEDTVRRMKI